MVTYFMFGAHSKNALFANVISVFGEGGRQRRRSSSFWEVSLRGVHIMVSLVGAAIAPDTLENVQRLVFFF